jgi:hypothetical protein
MFFELLAMLIFGAGAAAVIYLACLTVDAIADQVREWWGSRKTVTVLDPSTSAELARIARENGSKRHKRFVYNRERNEARLVESDSISSDFANRSEVELYVS